MNLAQKFNEHLNRLPKKGYTLEFIQTYVALNHTIDGIDINANAIIFNDKSFIIIEGTVDVTLKVSKIVSE